MVREPPPPTGLQGVKGVIDGVWSLGSVLARVSGWTRQKTAGVGGVQGEESLVHDDPLPRQAGKTLTR